MPPPREPPPAARFAHSLAASLALALALAPSPAGAERLRLVGSDLLEETLEGTLEHLAEVEGDAFEIDLKGSSVALEALAAGEADLAVVAIPRNTPTPDTERFALVPFGYLVTVIAVNANNPLKEIALGDIAPVFADNKGLNKTRWHEFGLTGPWQSRKISTHVTSNRASLALELMVHLAVGKSPLKATTREWEKPEELIKHVQAESSAIAQLPAFRAMDESGLKILFISAQAGGVPFGPKPENVHFGDYPLSMPFFVVFDKASQDLVKPYVKHLLGPAITEKILDNHLMPLPESVRNAEILKLDIAPAQ